MQGTNFIKRNPNFLLIWLGQILSQSGGRMVQMAMIWWILKLECKQPGLLVGIFLVLAAIPSLAFVKIIGSWIDRGSSQRILVLSDLCAFLTVGIVSGLIRNDWLGLSAAMSAGFLAATLQAIIDPTLNKSVQDITPDEDTESAVALLASTQSLANFSGAVLGAIFIDWLGISGTIALASGGYLVSGLCSYLARFKPALVVNTHSSHQRVAVFSRYPELKKILVGFGLINFFATPTLVVLPLYTKKTLLGSPSTLGLLEASLWIGLIFGTFVARWLNYQGQRVHLGAVCLSVFGLSLLVPGIHIDVFTYQLALFVGGAAIGVNNVKFMTFFQQVVSPDLKGRFFALLQATIGFTFPVAYFLFGAMTDFVSPPSVCLIQGVGVLALALGFLKLSQAEANLSMIPARGVL